MLRAEGLGEAHGPATGGTRDEGWVWRLRRLETGVEPGGLAVAGWLDRVIAGPGGDGDVGQG